LKDGYQSLIRLPGISEGTADALFEAGFGSAREVMEADPAVLAQLLGNDTAKAAHVQEAARLYMENLAREDAATEALEQMAKEIRALPSVSESDDEAADLMAQPDETEGRPAEICEGADLDAAPSFETPEDAVDN